MPYKTNSLVMKECFQYDAKFRKLGKDCDVVVDSGCLRYDIYSTFKTLCSL